MALAIPPLSCLRPITPGDHAEHAVLQALADGLPEAYTLFHGVRWALAKGPGDLHGELDVVVVNAAGDVAVLEVKAGEVLLTAEGLFKRYGALQKDVGQQAHRQFGGVLRRLKQLGVENRLLHFLVLPGQVVDEAGGISFPRERIADAHDCLDLPGFIQRTLGAGLPSPEGERVRAFFENRLSLEADAGALAGALRSQVRAIAGGLATWVPRIEAPSGVVRVCATAGSGKTQLALRLLREAVAQDQACAYVCFNRPLSEHVRGIAPARAAVHSFHQLCWEQAGRPSGQPDFEALSAQYLAHCQAHSADLDLLVIDEMQDLQAAWVQALVSRLKPGGRLYLLDDPAQCLYDDREELEVPEAVIVRSQENFRTPQACVQAINQLGLTPEAVQACSPYPGELPGFHCHGEEDGALEAATADAVQRCLDKGLSLSDVVVLSWRGLERSRLMPQDTLRGWRLQRFLGRYDERGDPLLSEGELRLETLRRFKGQSAPAVVLTEVDFDALTPLRQRLLFVGMTRASMQLELVLSRQALEVLAGRIQD